MERNSAKSALNEESLKLILYLCDERGVREVLTTGKFDRWFSGAKEISGSLNFEAPLLRQ